MTTALSLKILRGFRHHQRSYATISKCQISVNTQTVSSINSNRKSSTDTFNCCWKSKRTLASNATHARTTCPHLSSTECEETRVKGDCNVDIAQSSSGTEWEYALPYEDIPGPKPIPILGNTWRWVLQNPQNLKQFFEHFLFSIKIFVIIYFPLLLLINSLID